MAGSGTHAREILPARDIARISMGAACYCQSGPLALCSVARSVLFRFIMRPQTTKAVAEISLQRSQPAYFFGLAF